MSISSYMNAEILERKIQLSRSDNNWWNDIQEKLPKLQPLGPICLHIGRKSELYLRHKMAPIKPIILVSLTYASVAHRHTAKITKSHSAWKRSATCVPMTCYSTILPSEIWSSLLSQRLWRRGLATTLRVNYLYNTSNKIK